MQAGSSTGLQTLATGEIEVVKSGYLTVFVSNRSSSYKAYFDNLSIEHRSGPLLAEDDYYPFGLTMAGVSSKAANKLDNKLKYNGIEFNDDIDLDSYEAFYRNLDPQIGRWWQIDPKIESMEAWSPYASNYDNPVRYSDRLGDDPILSGIWQGIKNFGKGLLTPPAVTLYNITSSVIKGDVKPAVSFLVPAIAKTDDAIAFINGNSETRSEIVTRTFLETGAAFAGEKIFGAKGTVETETLYRGVNESHPGYIEATKGTALPRGGNATPLEHNTVTTESNYTSWSTNEQVAENYALRPNGSGIVLTKTVPKSSTVTSPNLKNINLKQSPGTIVSESEVLLKGPVTGASIRIVPFL